MITSDNLTRLFSKDLIYGILIKILLIFSQVLVIPLFISVLGEQMYGEWIMLTTIPNYLMLSDMGLTASVSNQISAYNISKEYEKMSKLFKSTNYIILIVGIVVIVLFFVSTIFINFSKLLNIKVMNIFEVNLILLLLLSNVVVSVLFNFNISFYRVLDKYYMYQKFLLINYALDLVVTVSSLLLNMSLIFMSCLFIVIRILLLIMTIAKLSKYDNYEYGFLREVKFQKSLFFSAMNHTVYNLGFGLIIQGNTFIVGKVLGPSEVVKFNTTRTMVNTIRSLMSVMYLPTMSKYNILLLNNKLLEAKIIFRHTLYKVLFLSTLISIFIIINYEKLFVLWLHKDLSISDGFIMAMVISALIHTVWNTMSMLPLSINKSNILLCFPAVSVLGFVLQFFYIKNIGINFTGYIILFIDIIMLVLLLFQVKKIFREKNIIKNDCDNTTSNSVL
ncbi:hypothetical protein CLV58_103145 [Spirosoma oryzae]|uniref:O-antigen/teichoic acid export membrane protein n=1 Tax=Spirosoma oryzae TaxID=1469603 RepID=A0A2T0TES7_9BACT|nr:hypothetical protein [Spirosoma oryzae]PRY44176.1 hypothetical protein CLV58_103145 [Spirosoma oryzae]